MVDDGSSEITSINIADADEAGSDMAVRKEPARMTLDEARIAFAEMFAVDPTSITSKESLQSAYVRFSGAVGAMANHLLDTGGTVPHGPTHHYLQWEDEDGYQQRFSVDYPQEAGAHLPRLDYTVKETTDLRAKTTPAEVTLSSQRP